MGSWIYSWAPLRAAFEQVGAVFILIAAYFIGIILVTGMTFKEALSSLWRLTKTIFLRVANSVRLAMGETKDEIASEQEHQKTRDSN